MNQDEIMEQFRQFYALRGLKIKIDGVVCPPIFARTSPKILWILKEFNGGNDQEEGSILTDLCNCAQQHSLGGYKKTYELIIQTSWLILRNQWEKEWNKPYEDIPDTDVLCADVLPKIAVINVKKTAGKGQADDSVIAATYADEKIKTLLQQQILFINPDVIINASGVTQLFNDLTHLNLQARVQKEHLLFKQSYWLDHMKSGCFTWAKNPSYTLVQTYHSQRPKGDDTKAEYIRAILKCLADSQQQP